MFSPTSFLEKFRVGKVSFSYVLRLAIFLVSLNFSPFYFSVCKRDNNASVVMIFPSSGRSLSNSPLKLFALVEDEPPQQSFCSPDSARCLSVLFGLRQFLREFFRCPGPLQRFSLSTSPEFLFLLVCMIFFFLGFWGLGVVFHHLLEAAPFRLFSLTPNVS